jgi:TPR repeat protein
MAGPLEDGVAAFQHGDYATAMGLLRPLAEQGNDRAQVNLGWMYENGRGVPQDHAQAAFWYRKAAEQGNAHAQSNLGAMYANGQGVPQDYAQAVAWFHKAADQGGRPRAEQPRRGVRQWPRRATGLRAGRRVVPQGRRSGGGRRAVQSRLTSTALGLRDWRHTAPTMRNAAYDGQRCHSPTRFALSSGSLSAPACWARCSLMSRTGRMASPILSTSSCTVCWRAA